MKIGREQVLSRYRGSRPLRPADTAARPYQSEGLAGGRYGALERALLILSLFCVAVAPLAGCNRVVKLGFTPQPGWIEENPSSSTRVAEYRLRGDGGPSADARLVVYHFGNRGAGTIEANLERWYGQFEQPDGRPSSEVASVSERRINGLAVTAVDLAGTFVAETAPGSGERHHDPGFRMLAAIVSTDVGPYYIKLVGPAGTVARWDGTWDDFLGSVYPDTSPPDERDDAEHP